MPVPVTEDALREREQQMYDTMHAAGKSPAEYLVAVNADRRQRWEAWLLQMEVPEALTAWAAAMTMLEKSATVRVHRNQVPWIVALLVVRYGEAEHFWPHAFSDADVQRAQDWYSGKNVPADLTAITGVE
jgi:hypothetical protein